MKQTVGNIRWWLRHHLNPCYDAAAGEKPLSGRIHCMDGVSLSVQASSSHYSTPREDFGMYTEVEVWSLEGVAPEDVVEWEYSADNPSGYVPIEAVVQFILRHGGLDSRHLRPQYAAE